MWCKGKVWKGHKIQQQTVLLISELAMFCSRVLLVFLEEVSRSLYGLLLCVCVDCWSRHEASEVKQ